MMEDIPVTKPQSAEPTAAKTCGNKKDEAPLGRLLRRSAGQVSRRLRYPIPASAIIEVAA